MINLATESPSDQSEEQGGDNRVRIRSSVAGHQGLVLAKGGAPPAATPGAQLAYAAATPAQIDTEPPKEPGPDPNLLLVRSPIVGTFYEGSAPGSPPFVRVGERVQPGKVLCIIESMKLMNEIEAEVSGIVESKLVMNGQPVEYGEALFAIRSN